jgi:GNAT superfamily N-acetyltransferase
VVTVFLIQLGAIVIDNIIELTHENLKIYWSAPDMWGNNNLQAVNPFTYDGKYDEAINNVEVYFYGLQNEGHLMGVNSMYVCPDNSVRSRGLYVFPEYRNQGVATQLLQHCIDEASKSGLHDYIWSKPRVSAIEAYKKVGFRITSDVFTKNPDGTPTLWPNAMARYDIEKQK